MSERIIKIGIVGYGNLGKGVEKALSRNEDFRLEAIFTRRDPAQVGVDDYERKSASKLVPLSKVHSYVGKIEVMILCGGSAMDLPEQGPALATLFNTVDSFDNHARIPAYFDEIDKVAREAKTVSLISAGWDPGLFSLNRLLFASVLPAGRSYTFWGEGVSQGHSDAIRRVEGVRDGIQYTVPVKEALERIRRGDNPQLAAAEKHRRICYIVPEEGADLKMIESSIKNMPAYFAGYETEVHFISAEELKRDHTGMPHGGMVIGTGTTGAGHRQRIEFGLTLESNPEFTGSILVAYARAVHRLAKEGHTGALTVFDIPFGYLSPCPAEQLRKELL